MDEIVRSLTIDVSAGRYGVVTIAVLVAGLTDALWLKIPNIVTLPLIVSGLVYHAFFPAEQGALFSLLGAAIGFGILAPFFAAGGAGAGDVKLLTGIGAWIGPHDVLVVFVVAGLLVGASSLAMMAWTGTWSAVPRRSKHRGDPPVDTVDRIAREDEPARRRRLVPMGTMIAIALLILMIGDLLDAGAAGGPADATGTAAQAATRG